MTWEKWAIIGFLALGALIGVANIGKPRNPTDATTAVIHLLLTAGLCVLVVFA